MIKTSEECKLTHRELADIASRICVDYSKLQFEEDFVNSSDDVSDSHKAWDDLTLLYSVISQFIGDRPLTLLDNVTAY